MAAGRPPDRFPPPLDYRGPATAYEPLPPEALDRGLFVLFARQAARQPESPALVDGALTWTYAQLLDRARQGAAAIRQQALSPGAPVGIWMGKSAEAVALLLACLQTGHPYLPFDLAMPADRNRAIAEHAGLGLLIGYAAELAEAPAEVPHLPVEAIRAAESEPDPEPTGGPDSVAYILYTSGTTGRPKGVYQNQRGLLHDVRQYIDSVHLGPHDRHSLLYSLAVIGSVRDLYGTLLTGGCVYLYEPTRQGVAGIAAFVQEHRLTIYHSFPLLFRGFLSVAREPFFPSVRLVYLAGDRIYRADVEQYRRCFPESARLYVGIGSTENATIYRQWFLDHRTALDTELIPVGYAVPDRSMALWNADGQPVAQGEVGEIVVTSAYLALGYWQDPEQSAKAFAILDGQRRFRTGDLGQLRPDGLLAFIGRRDRQLKLSGYRVEPAEIEAVLLRAPGVRAAAVLVRDADAGGGAGPALVAYLESDGMPPTNPP